MYLNPDWRILTVGDGDLSFTRALLNHIDPSQLHGSVYDSEEVLRDKYQQHAVDDLIQCHVPLLFEFDVTNPLSWQRLQGKQFDLVIFQFPLLSQLGSADAFKAIKQAGGLNTLNRALLHQYLFNCAKYALDPNGAGVCYITSKDVKPYSHWGLDHALTVHTPLHYIGEQNFDLKAFAGYKVRNVDRDKHVKDTLGISYTYALQENNSLAQHCHRPHYLDNDNCCLLCRAGPFQGTLDKDNHLKSKSHQQMQLFSRHWDDWLSRRYDQ